MTLEASDAHVAAPHAPSPAAIADNGLAAEAWRPGRRPDTLENRSQKEEKADFFAANELAGGSGSCRRPSRALALALAALTIAGTIACRRDTPREDATGIARGGELVASIRSEPGNYNRYYEATAPADLVSLLTQARLVRVDRVTDTLGPALAESWEASGDREWTLRLRRDIRFSDGTPFTAADVLFSFDVAYAPKPESGLARSLEVGGKRLELSSPDPHTVIVFFPQPFAPGVRLLEHLPILPKHRLEAAFRNGTIDKAWASGTPPAEVVGLGPFVLAEHTAGRRMVFNRNPHYWMIGEDEQPLPYLDRIRVEVVPEQNTEALRLESGAIDLMSNADLRPDDYGRFKSLAEAGRIRLVDVGVALDPNILWFNLKVAAGPDPKPWLRREEFRQALSYGTDRQAFINTVYLGAGVPLSGPVTPGNKTWYSESVPAYAHDPARARQLLAKIGLVDRNGDGTLEDANGRPVRFSVLLQGGHTIRERSVAVLQEQYRRLGIGVDVVPLDTAAVISRWRRGDYDSIFHGFQTSSTDPAMTLDFWLSSGPSHFWNPRQQKPATAWEAQIDELMHRQVAAPDLAERQRLFAEVQRIFGEHLPALYFAAPRVTAAASTRVTNLRPAPFVPQLLWSADTLAVTGQ